MGWDIFVQDLPHDAKSVYDISSDFNAAPLGKRSEIIARIREVVPSADFSDPSWGVLDGEGWSIEFNMGDEEVCGSFAFHVHGGGAAPGIVAAVLEKLNLRALDPGGPGGFFVAGDEATNSFEQWQHYRDQIVANTEKRPSTPSLLERILSNFKR